MGLGGMGKGLGVWLCEGSKGVRPNNPAIFGEDRWGRRVGDASRSGQGCKSMGGRVR